MEILKKLFNRPTDQTDVSKWLAYGKIKNTIESCETYTQLKGARRMVQTFYKTYSDRDLYWRLYLMQSGKKVTKL